MAFTESALQQLKDQKLSWHSAVVLTGVPDKRRRDMLLRKYAAGKLSPRNLEQECRRLAIFAEGGRKRPPALIRVVHQAGGLAKDLNGVLRQCSGASARLPNINRGSRKQVEKETRRMKRALERFQGWVKAALEEPKRKS